VRRDSTSYVSSTASTIYLGDRQTAEEDCYSCYLFFTCCDPYTAYRERILYLLFDLQQLGGFCLQSATLKLTRSSGNSPQGNNLIYLRRTGINWDESSLSWSNRGSVPVIESAAAQLFASDSPDVYSLEVPISFVESALSSALSLQVEMNNGGSANVQTAFFSKDQPTQLNYPVLEVLYVDCGSNAFCNAERACQCQNGFELDQGECVGGVSLSPSPLSTLFFSSSVPFILPHPSARLETNL